MLKRFHVLIIQVYIVFIMIGFDCYCYCVHFDVHSACTSIQSAYLLPLRINSTLQREC